MRKLKRRKIIREFLEEKLKKNERRMQRISEESYKIRLSLEQLDAQPTQVPYVKPKDGEATVIGVDPALPGTDKTVEQEVTPNAVS